MKIYHTETQEDFDELMVELERQGIGTIPKERWKNLRHETVVFVHAIDKNHNSSRNDTTCSDVTWSLYKYPDAPIIKYKAKECAKVEYVIEFGEYFYKKSCNDNDGSRTIIVTSKVKDAYWFSCKENAIEVSKLVGGVVKELTTQIAEV